MRNRLNGLGSCMKVHLYVVRACNLLLYSVRLSCIQHRDEQMAICRPNIDHLHVEEIVSKREVKRGKSQP
jgi:hypothetical protein